MIEIIVKYLIIDLWMDLFNNNDMKKIILLFILSILFTLPSYAHAGMYDRFLDIMVSFRAMFFVVLFTHISCILCVKYFKAAFFSKLQIRIIRLINYIQRNKITMYFSSWLFSSFVYGIYLILISGQIFFWGFGIPFILFFILIIIWTIRKKWREKYLFGTKALFCYIQSSVFILVGIILYSVLSQLDLFKRLFSYTDEEYQLANFYLYPEWDSIYLLASNLIECYLFFIIPYLPLIIYLIIRFFYNNLKTNKYKLEL